jgi:uncharacterized cupredoxin-like copper-binding protein
MTQKIGRRSFAVGSVAAALALGMVSFDRGHADAEGDMSSMNMSGGSCVSNDVSTGKISEVMANTRVMITLSEFKIALTPNELPVFKKGEATDFFAFNAGEENHELMLVDAQTAAMFDDMAGSMDMESMDSMALLTISNLTHGSPPTSAQFAFNAAGDYVLGCWLPGHEGMRATITVVD